MRVFIVVLLVCTVISGCQTEQITYQSPSDEQIDSYISDNNLEPLLIESRENYVTILCENSIHSISINKKGKLSRMYSSWSRGNNKMSVLSSSRVNEGKPTITVVLHDEELIAKATKISVTFSDGTLVSEQIERTRGFILEYPMITTAYKPYKKIELFQGKNVIFTQ